jgi:hypothetical protein
MDQRKRTTPEQDVGRTDRYDNDNKDEAGFNVRNGRRVSNGGSAQTDGKQDEDPDDPGSDVNRDE